MPIVKAAKLRKLGFDLFVAVGVPRDAAVTISNILVDTSLYGIDSHGFGTISDYVEEIQSGMIKPHSKIKIVKETLTTTLLDANGGSGFIAAKKAMELAVKKGKQNTIGVVGINNCGHIGALFWYATAVVKYDMIGIIMCKTGPIMAPWGGRERLLGVNPFAIAIPGDANPIVLDVATSIVAVGHAHMKHIRKEKIPDGWFLDSQGNPTTRFEDFAEGGSILPFGMYKGYGIALIIEILAGILIEADRNEEFKIARKAGVLIAAIDIKGFTQVNEFKESVGNLIGKIKSSKRRPGIDEILVPGELEFEAKKKREKEGIFIEELLWEKIIQKAEDLGVDSSKYK